MATFRAYDLHIFPEGGAVQRGGGSLSLGKGTVGISNVNWQGDKKGWKLVDNFNLVGGKDRLQILQGVADTGVSRTRSNKSVSIPYSFSLGEIDCILVDAPKTNGLGGVDDFIIGFNGRDGSEISLGEGETEILQVSLSGPAIGALGFSSNSYTAQISLIRGNGETMQEVVERGALQLRDFVMAGGHTLSEFADVILVNSENAALTADTQFFEITIKDGCSFSDLAAVRKQYPDLDIKRKSCCETEGSVYVAIADAAPADYEKTSLSKMMECECPAEYTEIEGGFSYSVCLEDDGEDLIADVEALAGFVSGEKLEGQAKGAGTYKVITDHKLTDEELEAFILANPTAEVSGGSVVASLCEPPADACPIAWVPADECASSEEKYTICLPDAKCEGGESRLEELQLNYPDLTIAEVADSAIACQRVYETTVPTNLVCEECDPIFQDIFSSEAPADYDMTSWQKEDKVYSEDAKMGIRIRGKQTILSAGECLRDEVPFIYDSVRISLAGGFTTMFNEAYGRCGDNDRFEVKMLNRHKPADNLGGHFRPYEERSKQWFLGGGRHKGNNFAKHVLGEESVLDAKAQYIDYTIIIQTDRTVSMPTQGFRQRIAYHFIVPVGGHNDIEDMLNDIASAAGLPSVQAFATV